MSISNHSYIAFLFRHPLPYYIRTCFIYISGRTGSTLWAKFQPDFLNPFALIGGCILYSMISTPIVVFLRCKKSSLSVFVIFLYLGVCISIQPIKIPLFLSTDGRMAFCCGKWAHLVCNKLRGANFLSFLIPLCTILKSNHGLKKFGLRWGCGYFKTV